MIDTSNIEKTRQLLRELQKMIFDNNSNKNDLFSITTEIEKYLNKSIIDFNKKK